MFKKTNYLLFAILILFCSAPLLHADLTKADEQEVNAYRLTKPKIAQFWNATKNLLAAYEKNPKLFDDPEGKKNEDDNNQGTLADIVKATNSIPAAKKAIEDAGMTAKEYWTFQLAMIYAGTGHMVKKSGGKLPEGFSTQNVEFYGANEAEFMKLDKDLKALNEITNKPSSAEETEEEAEEEVEE